MSPFIVMPWFGGGERGGVEVFGFAVDGGAYVVLAGIRRDAFLFSDIFT